jgi:diguanylate cyclase
MIFLILILAVAALLVWGMSNTSRAGHLRNELTNKEEEIRVAQAKIEQLARIDPLTGALNRRTLMEMLEAELQRSNRTGHPFCFVILDLDHFKGINDQFGHPVGDQVLKAMAETSIKLLRALDRFGRLDGEEFGIVLPATWLDQGVIAMNRLTKAVADRDWQAIAPGLKLTFSAGLTTNATGDTAESITKRAEKALAQAKSEGRNRTVQAEEALPDMPIIID